MEKPKILVILGSIRQGRQGEKVGKWFMEAIKDNLSADLEFVDLLDYPMPLFNDSVPPSTREGKHSNPAVQKWLDKIDSADGYIIISAEYNHSVPSGLKNAIDYGFKEWNDKAVGIVSYGNLAGGSRAAEHLRQIAAELRMYTPREQLIIPTVWAAFDEQNKLIGHNESQSQNARNLLDSVARLAVAVKPFRQPVKIPVSENTTA